VERQQRLQQRWWLELRLCHVDGEHKSEGEGARGSQREEWRVRETERELGRSSSTHEGQGHAAAGGA